MLTPAGVGFSPMALTARLVINHKRRNEWRISNVYMWPLSLCSGTEQAEMAAQHFPPYTFSEVVLLRPYITLTRVHSLKRADQTPSLHEDIFAIPLGEVCVCASYHCHTSTSLKNTHILSPTSGQIKQASPSLIIF